MNIASRSLRSFFTAKFLNTFHQSGTALCISFFPFSEFFLTINLCCNLFFASPIRQAIALVVKDIVHTCETAHLPIFLGMVDPRHGSCARLIKRDLLPDFGLSNPEIIALHDLGGVVTILNRFTHLRNSARQQTGIKSGLSHRKDTVPFGPELIPGLKLVPHPFSIAVIKKIALLCACVAGRLCWRSKQQEAQNDGI